MVEKGGHLLNVTARINSIENRNDVPRVVVFLQEKQRRLLRGLPENEVLLNIFRYGSP